MGKKNFGGHDQFLEGGCLTVKKNITFIYQKLDAKYFHEK